MSLLGAPLLARGSARPPLWLIFTFVICGTLSLHIFVPALPAAARDLGVSSSTIELTLTVYVIGLALGQLFYGPLSDRFGRRPVLLGGLVLYAAGSVIAGLAPTALALIAARVVQALGGCSGLVLGRAVIRDVSAPKEAAARLAWLNMFMSMAPASAYVIGGLLAGEVGWRAIFALLAAIGVLTFLAAILTLPETNATRGHGSGAGLVRINLRLLGLPGFRVYALAGACATTSFYAFLAAAPFIFTDTLHESQSTVGFYFVLPMLGYSVGSLIANRLVGRLGVDRLLSFGFALAGLGATLFFAIVVSGHLSVIAVMGAMLIFTAGGGTASPLALSGAISALPGAIGAASGLYGFLQMGFGAVCTLAISLFPRDPALTAAVVMLAASITSLTVFLRRPAAPRPP